MSKNKSKFITCLFTSIWDDKSQIVTPAEVCLETGEINAMAVDFDTDAALEREFITLYAGTSKEEDFEVCTDCHAFVMKTVMNPGIGHDLYEEEECSNPGCDSHKRV